MPEMIFVGGAIAGFAVGLVAGGLLQRRSGRANFLDGRGVATTIALIALVVAAVALANSERDRDEDQGSTVAAVTTTTTPSPAGTVTASSTTTIGSEPTGLVSVPNVSHPPLERKDAVEILERAGLEVSIESLPLANVPSGFVIQQDPLPAAKVAAGSTVTLTVSAAA